jgi:hypothetical protein
MARLPLLPRLLRQQSDSEADPSDDSPAPAPAAATPAPPARRRPAPGVGELRRERRALIRVREERLRDLGGLALEMYRRDRFREDLILERCAELIGLEARVHELDTLLGGSRAARTRARCECGAPLLLGTRFCANCGRPVTAEPAGAPR